MGGEVQGGVLGFLYRRKGCEDAVRLLREGIAEPRGISGAAERADLTVTWEEGEDLESAPQ